MKEEKKGTTYLVKVQVVAEQVVAVKECSTKFDAEFVAIQKVKKEIEDGNFQIPLLVANYSIEKTVKTELDVWK